MADDLSSGESGENAGKADGANAGELTQETLSAALSGANGTAANQTSQQDSNAQGEQDAGKGAEGSDGGKGDDTKPTPQQEAIAAQRKADLLKMAQSFGLDGEYETVEALQEALSQKAAAEHEEELESDTTALYNRTLRDIATSLKATKLTTKGLDADGNEVDVELALSDEQIQQAVVSHLNKLRPEIRSIEAGETFADLGAAAMDLLPEDSHEAFGKAVASGLSVRQWIEQLVEHAAPASKWGKAQAADKEAHGKAEFARGWDEGNKAPAGQVSQAGAKGAVAASINGKSAQEVAGLLESGELNFEKALAEAWASN